MLGKTDDYNVAGQNLKPSNPRVHWLNKLEQTNPRGLKANPSKNTLRNLSLSHHFSATKNLISNLNQQQYTLIHSPIVSFCFSTHPVSRLPPRFVAGNLWSTATIKANGQVDIVTWRNHRRWKSWKLRPGNHHPHHNAKATPPAKDK